MVDNGVIADDGVDDSRRKFLLAATVATGTVGAVFTAVPFISSWTISERDRALGAPTEFDLSKLEPGQMALAKWRKQPIYVVRRTPEMLKLLTDHDSRLKDPKSEDSEQPDYANNPLRSRNGEYLILIAVCTHLGCLPKARFEPAIPELGGDWPGGFACPCHGSRFDLAGRVFEGSPASKNLKVPPYAFADNHKLIIGVDDAKGAV